MAIAELKYNSSGRIITNPDGSLAIDCCCNECSGNCCCDTTKEPWYQPVIIVSILKVKVSDQIEYDPLILSCLEGDWPLPWGNTSESLLGDAAPVCRWYNTFTAGSGTDQAVFYIEASMPDPALDDNSSNLSCLTITIKFLSCKDCLGNILAKKPDILLSIAAQVCGEEYPESANYDDLSSNACGCNDAAQVQNIPGVLDIPSGDPIAYSGQCWEHPLVQDNPEDYATSVTLDNPYIYPALPGGHPLEGLDLSSLIANLDYTVSGACDWMPDEDTEDLGFTAHLVLSESEECGYVTQVGTPYADLAAIAAQLPLGYTISTAPDYFNIGCAEAHPTANLVCTITDDAELVADVNIYIEAALLPTRYDTCTQELVIYKPEILCTSHTSELPTCDCEVPSATPYYTVHDVNLRAFPSEEAMPTFTDDCATLDATAGCACPATKPFNWFCCAALFFVDPPTEFKADDYAPIGARYEILYHIDGDTQSLIYIKSNASDTTTYPKGKWLLESSWADAPLFSLNTELKCVGSNGCSVARARFNSIYWVEWDVNIQATKLHPDGVWAKHISSVHELLWDRSMGMWKANGDYDTCCAMDPEICETRCELTRDDCGYEDLPCDCDEENGCIYDFGNGATTQCCCSKVTAWSYSYIYDAVTTYDDRPDEHVRTEVTRTFTYDGIDCYFHEHSVSYLNDVIVSDTSTTLTDCADISSSVYHYLTGLDYDCTGDFWYYFAGVNQIIGFSEPDSVVVIDDRRSGGPPYSSTTTPGDYFCPDCVDVVTLHWTSDVRRFYGDPVAHVLSFIETIETTETYTLDKPTESECLSAIDAGKTACVDALLPDQTCDEGDAECMTFIATINGYIKVTGLTVTTASALVGSINDTLLIYVQMPDGTINCYALVRANYTPSYSPTCLAFEDGTASGGEAANFLVTFSLGIALSDGGCNDNCLVVLGFKACRIFPPGTPILASGTLTTTITGEAYKCDGTGICDSTPTVPEIGLYDLEGL